MQASLALPGVADEIRALESMMPGTSIVNEAFTLERFRDEAQTGTYRILHIASHGVFGGSAKSSFIMTYDDLLTIEGLQSLLSSDRVQGNPIEVLTLSACETAEGDDRSPLGIAGAAIKAKARSVVGTLWPVADEAARIVMPAFYGRFVNDRLSKTEAIRQAQLELLRTEKYAHPFFWAPFLLIGNWH